MDVSGKKVLVTGISGFTGVHLARRLSERGAVVSGLTNSLQANDPDNTYKASLEKIDELKLVLEKTKPDFIVHLAGLSFAALENLLPYYDVNVLGTQNLLEACLATGLSLQKIVIASSAAVYGDPGDIKVDENCKIAPLNHYGCSKLAMEYIAKTYEDRLPLILTRPFNYTGIGQPDHFLIPKIVKHFKDRAPTIELGNINVVREFSDVRDVVENYIALICQDQCGIVNLCSGRANTFKDIIATLEQLTNHQIEIRINQKFIRDKDIAALVGDPARLQSMTGLTYQYSLRDTLGAMLTDAL